MEVFDPLQERELLDGDVGYRWALGSDFDEYREAGALASCAWHDINTAVECLLVDYDDPARQLLEKAHKWLTVAVDGHDAQGVYDETSGIPKSQPYESIAMCNWLLDGRQDSENLARAVAIQEYECNADKGMRTKLNVSLTLAMYVDAGAYQQAVDRFTTTSGLTPPKSLSVIRGEGQMCYAICRQRLGREYTEAEVMAAAEKFLKRPDLNNGVNTWLLRGHYYRAARWMKIIHWHEGKTGISPKEVLLKCYDYLPTKGKD